MKPLTRCETCHWWRKVAESYTWGWCWRYPPTVVSRVFDGVNESLENCRPVLQPEEVCGEWNYNPESMHT